MRKRRVQKGFFTVEETLTNCPTLHTSDWENFLEDIEGLKVPEAADASLLCDYSKDFRRCSPHLYTLNTESNLQPLLASKLPEILSSESVRQFLHQWDEAVLPKADYPVPPPEKISVPQMVAKPLVTAGSEPQRPYEKDFGVEVRGVFDVVFGAGRRAAGRTEYEKALYKWRREHDDWQAKREFDQEELETFAEREREWTDKNAAANEKFDVAEKQWADDHETWKIKVNSIRNRLKIIKNDYDDGIESSIRDYFELCLRFSAYPAPFPRSVDVEFDKENGVVLAELQLPNLIEMYVVKPSSREKYVAISDRDRKKLHEQTVFAVAVRSMYELALADYWEYTKSIAFNGWVKYTDPTDGHEKSRFVISGVAESDKLRAMNLEMVQPKEAFLSFGGRFSPNLKEAVAIPPILELDKKDRRVVESNFSIDEVDSSTNLAAMDWEHFEHLIRELFSKEFGSEGAEVKVTQASHDGGVDAIAWDTDPIRGGKFVIQAKRYTNVVGVSAVRDLYGTTMNEGANRGILVTTSNYGADAINFAKDKPLTLLDGRQLLGLLEKHGYKFRLNIAEARKMMGMRAK